MFVNKEKEPYDNYISPTCPCGEFSTSEKEKLTPICYLSFLKAMSHNLIDSEKTIPPEEVIWCPDARSILDNRYPALIADKVHVSGFGHIKGPKLISVLKKLYWFRKYTAKYKLEQEVIKAMEGKPFGAFLQDLKQTLHSINGLLIKKFMALGPECVGYKELADQTARLFRDFILDYSASSREDIPLYARGSIFEDCKDFFNYVKEFHEHYDYNQRVSILNYKFRNRALGSFFGQEFRRVQSKILYRMNKGFGDYTQSLAWDYRCVELCQTRNLGYLPSWKARENDLAYRKKVSREPEPITEEIDDLIRSSIHQELELGGVKRDCLAGLTIDTESIISEAVNIELRYAASARTTVALGGKPEDARFYLQLIRENGWRIPIRNLIELDVIGMTPKLDIKLENNDDGFDLSSILFWFSFQNILNWCLERRLIQPKPGFGMYYPFKIGEEKIKIDLMKAVIILINEPGKGRILVKSESLLNWFLIPGSKMCQKVLAQHSDHKAGLELGSHDWVHSKRISGDSLESNFMFDKMTKRILPSIVSGYTDWTEATDGMKKRIGISHLRGLFEYTSFPRMYGIMIQIMIREPQNVSETIQVTLSDDYEDRIVYKWEGQIREGFMMGNQMTKTLLHLAHISERGISEKILNKKDINVIRTLYGRLRKTSGKIPHNVEEPIGRLRVLPDVGLRNPTSTL